MKLSQKQRALLHHIATQPIYGISTKLPLICIDRMPEEIWFTFRSERQAYAWVRNLAQRGLVEIEQDSFARITHKGITEANRKARSGLAKPSGEHL